MSPGGIIGGSLVLHLDTALRALRIGKRAARGRSPMASASVLRRPRTCHRSAHTSGSSRSLRRRIRPPWQWAKRAHILLTMCGRARLSTDYSEIRIKLKFDPDYPAPNIPASWNVCPTDPMLVAVRSQDGKRIPQQMRWGLVPWWAKDIKVGFSSINARAETVDTAPTLRTNPSQDPVAGLADHEDPGQVYRLHARSRCSHGGETSRRGAQD
jgi:SOS response associated peptidase (SRAP)